MPTIRYPKLLALGLTFVLAYFLALQGVFALLSTVLNGHGYVSAFFGGMLFSFGFTAALGIAIFVELSHLVSPLPGAIIGGLGSLAADALIFVFIRASFTDELERIQQSPVFARIHALLHHERFPERARRYLLWSASGFILASPLPDEIGVTMLSGLTNVEGKRFAVLCFVLNALGILTILLAARAL